MLILGPSAHFGLLPSILRLLSACLRACGEQ